MAVKKTIKDPQGRSIYPRTRPECVVYPDGKTVKDTIDEIELEVGQVKESVNGKQDSLVSGTNIKTVNGQSLLGSGNIEIQGGGAGDVTKKDLEDAMKDVAHLAGSSTEVEEVSGWVQKKDLAASVQDSLDKADSALQSVKTINGQSIVGTGNIEIQGGGGYEPPIGGIPKTDLSSDVQSSLGKADTALQQHQQIKTINGQSIVGSGDIEVKDGKEGKSAYQIALKNGFVGTEEEWLASLKGNDGTSFAGAIPIYNELGQNSDGTISQYTISENFAKTISSDASPSINCDLEICDDGSNNGGYVSILARFHSGHLETKKFSTEYVTENARINFLPFMSSINDNSKNSLCLCAIKTEISTNRIPFHSGFLFHKLPNDDRSIWYGSTLINAVKIGELDYYPKDCVLAVSPKDGRIIATTRGNRGSIHVWDGTNHTITPFDSLGNGKKPMGWLYNSGVDFVNDEQGNEYCIFAEYDGSAIDKGGFYVWKGKFPYTSVSDWKTTFHKNFQYYGTIEDNTITHFHQIRRDPWTGYLYLTSGDLPTQLKWWYSSDLGETWNLLTDNSTNGWEEHVCRLINFVFTKDWIYWATDHGTNHCLNRIKRNASNGVIDISTRERLTVLPFAQACNSVCYTESPRKGIFMYERIDTGSEYEPYYGGNVKVLFWDIELGKLINVSSMKLTNNSWGGHRGKCYINYTNGQQPFPAMGFSDDTRCPFDIIGADGSNIGTIYYTL